MTARTDQAQGREGRSGMRSPPHDGKLAVLFVHGMGEQEKGDTLIGLGEPILRFLNNWYHYATGHVLTSQSTIRTPSTDGHDYETGQSSRYATIAPTGSRSARR